LKGNPCFLFAHLILVVQGWVWFKRRAFDRLC
jgi:hypothetical protein